jgi:hypothetical protein
MRLYTRIFRLVNEDQIMEQKAFLSAVHSGS